jgi:hypothetical protein
VGGNRILRLLGDEAEQRRAVRTRTFLTAKLVSPARDYPVRIRDISASGARVEGIDLPAPGTLVEVQRGGFAALAEIVWRREGQAGLSFDEEIEEGCLFDLINQRQASARAEAEPFRRPGFERDGRQLWSDGRGWVEPTQRN